MKIKKGDKVKIITGKDSGKKGKVLQALNPKNSLVVEGLNLVIKHTRPRKQGEKGQRIQFPSPMDVSNVMFICPKCNKETRIGHKFLVGEKKKKKVRICKKCSEVVD